MEKYKGVSYRVIRSSFGTVNLVIVLHKGLQEQFDTIKEAKRYITLISS